VITFVARVLVKPENAAEFEALMTYVADMSRQHESGVVYYGFAKGVDEPNTYVVLEVYQNADAQANHMATEWVISSLPKAARLMEGRPDIKQYISEGSAPVVRRAQF
jgi:quinol monooxygenase YgiN